MARKISNYAFVVSALAVLAVGGYVSAGAAMRYVQYGHVSLLLVAVPMGAVIITAVLLIDLIVRRATRTVR